jgi:PAS domain S-box-containing protein
LEAGVDHFADAIVEHSLDGILLTIPDGRTLAANPAACAILGGTEEEICRLGRDGVSDPSDPGWEVALAKRSRAGSMRAVLTMRRVDGKALLAEIASTLFTSPEGEPRALVIFRDVTERERLRQGLQASNEITRALLAAQPTADVLTLIAGHARSLVGATDSLVVVVSAPPDTVRVVAADGTRVSSVVGRSFQPPSFAVRAMVDGESMLIDDLSAVARSEEARDSGLGPAMVVPIVSGTRAFGNLVVTTEPGSGRYTESDLAVVEWFAAAAGVALALGEARAEAERMAVFDEQRRIAGEIYDGILHTLHATARRLDVTAALAGAPAADQLRQSVAVLDEVISQIRETIFALKTTERPGLAVSG